MVDTVNETASFPIAVEDEQYISEGRLVSGNVLDDDDFGEAGPKGGTPSVKWKLDGLDSEPIEGGVLVRTEQGDVKLYDDGRYEYLPVAVSVEASNMPLNVSVRKDARYTVSGQIPTAPGYKFSHWTDEQGVRYNGGDYIDVTEPTELTANWINANTLPVTYLSGLPYSYTGYEPGMPAQQQVQQGQCFELSTEQPTAEGYIFAGWSVFGDESFFGTYAEGATGSEKPLVKPILHPYSNITDSFYLNSGRMARYLVRIPLLNSQSADMKWDITGNYDGYTYAYDLQIAGTKAAHVEINGDSIIFTDATTSFDQYGRAITQVIGGRTYTIYVDKGEREAGIAPTLNAMFEGPLYDNTHENGWPKAGVKFALTARGVKGSSTINATNWSPVVFVRTASTLICPDRAVYVQGNWIKDYRN